MKTPLSLRAYFGSTLLCLLALGAGDASAATLTVTGYTLGESVQVASASRTGWVNTAQLKLSTTGASGFGYCVDLAQEIGLGSSNGWDMRSWYTDAVVRAAWLVDTFQPTLGSSATGIAALQVSIWEVMGESTGNYDLDSGLFSLTGASAGVTDLAHTLLGKLGDADLANFNTTAIWATSRTFQDQLFVTRVNPIPEPSTVALYAFGAALVGISLRRKLA